MSIATDPRPQPHPEARCNICGSGAYDVVHAAGRAQVHQIVRCAACGLMYAYPRNRSNLARYDKDDALRPPTADVSHQLKHTADKLADYARVAGALEEFLPRKGRLIEVGAFSGVLTDHLRKAGWDAVGIEPDGRAAAYARATYGVEVHQATLETVDLPDGSADAVVMLHVIEHVDDPAENVRRVHGLLREGGVFAVETPTYDSLSYRLIGRRERSINCNGHIFFYTERTLTDLLRRCGFRILRVQKVGRTMSVERLLWTLGIMAKSQGLRARLQALSERFRLERRYLYLNLGDMVRVYAAKA